MPAIPVDFSPAIRAAQLPPQTPTLADYSSIVSTPTGLTLIEIQGDLSVPLEKPHGLSEKEETLFEKREIPPVFSDGTETGPVDVVRFGRLEIDDTMTKATLFVSSTQRLIGTIEKIDPPLGVLKVVHPHGDDASETHCEVVDVVRRKAVFRHRPLPIM